MSTEKKPGPTVEFVVKVTQEDGTVVEKAVRTSAEMLPAPEDFDIMTKEGFLRDFGKMETFLLQAREQFTDAAFDAYMQAVKNESIGVITRKAPIESEVGRLECPVGGTLGAELKPKEIVRSNQFTETMLLVSSRLSFRDTTMLLNRCYHRDDADEIKVMTQRDLVGKYGAMIQTELSELATRTFEETFPDMTGAMPTQQQLAEWFPSDTWAAGPTEDEIERAQLAWLIDRYNEDKEPPLQITRRDLICLS